VTKRVVIIGGGVTGLACAAQLLEREPACEVTVVEAEEHVGGLASLWRCGPYAADLGPHRIYTELPEIAALLPQLIEKEQELTVERRSQLLLDGHFYEYPVRATELLRVMGPLRMAGYGFSAAAGQVRALVRRPRNYAEAMCQAFGAAVYGKIIAPYTRKVWKTPPEQLSEEVARVRVSAGNTQKLVQRLIRRGDKGARQTALDSFTYIRGGVEGLVRVLERKVLERGGAIEAGVRAAKLEVARNRVVGVCAEATSADASDSYFDTTAVVSTIPISELARLVPQLPPDATRAAGQLEFVGMMLVGVAIAKPRMSPNTWLYFPEEQLVFNRAYEPKNFDAGMAPEDRTFVVFEVTARHDSALWQMSDCDVGQLVVHDAAQTGLIQKDDVLDVFVRRLPWAYPIYTVDFRRHLNTVCEGLGQVDNLLTTGRQGLFNHNNMDHCMLMGMRAAQTLIEHEEAPAAAWYANLGQFSHFRIVD
jgi:protoporphyrinogen oxidase